MDDIDSLETREWLDALDSVIKVEGKDRAAELLTKLEDSANDQGVELKPAVVTPYRNTIRLEDETPLPGDLFM
ncbi:MAG: hypothetical protein RLN82_03180, partial [Pseudomonadales bacterium]